MQKQPYHFELVKIYNTSICIFQVSKSDIFRRAGADVHSDADISISQAALGGSIDVQGVYEKLTIDVRNLH